MMDVKELNDSLTWLVESGDSSDEVGLFLKQLYDNFFDGRETGSVQAFLLCLLKEFARHLLEDMADPKSSLDVLERRKNLLTIFGVLSPVSYTHLTLPTILRV